MSIALASLIWQIVGVYFAIGLLFSLLYMTVLVGGLDPAAKGMKLSVRLLVMPGVMFLWPVMLIKTVLRKGPPVQ